MKKAVAAAMVGLLACSVALATTKSVSVDSATKSGTWTITVDPFGSGGGRWDIYIYVDGVLQASDIGAWEFPDGVDTDYTIVVFDGELLEVDLVSYGADYDLEIYDEQGNYITGSFSTGLDGIAVIVTTASSSSGTCVPGNGSFAGFLAFLLPLAGGLILRRKVQPIAA